MNMADGLEQTSQILISIHEEFLINVTLHFLGEAQRFHYYQYRGVRDVFWDFHTHVAAIKRVCGGGLKTQNE